VRRDVFWVAEPEGARWRVALELLAEGKSITCLGITFTLARETPGRSGESGDTVKVRFQTRHDSSRLTPEQAAVEIDNAEAGVAEIRERSPEFAGIISGRPILYELLDDYGMGAVRLAFKDRSGFHFERCG
jgi:hypothetical protein